MRLVIPARLIVGGIGIMILGATVWSPVNRHIRGASSRRGSESVLSVTGVSKPKAATVSFTPTNDQSSATNLTQTEFGDLTRIPELLDRLEGLPETEQKREAIKKLERRWAESRPEEAMLWALSLPAASERQSAVADMLPAWADVDFTAALHWLGTLPDGETKAASSLSLAYEAARTAPVASLELASTLSPSASRDNLLEYAVRQWAATEPEAAAAWALAVPDAKLEQRLVAAVTVASAKQDPVKAANLATTELQSGPLQQRSVVSIVQRWAASDPEGASGWVLQFPETPVRDSALRELVSVWNGKDPAGLNDWINRLPAGGLREATLADRAQAARF